MAAPHILQTMTRLAVLAFLSIPLVSQAADPPAAKIVSLQGSGQSRPENAQKWDPASVNQALYPGYFVRTGDLSRMALTFTDQTQVSLNQNSQLQIKQVQDTQKSLNTTLRLNQGRSWTQSKQISQRLTMETPSATAAIRGTDWEMEVDAGGKSTLTVLSGEVEFYNEQGKLLVQKNEQAVAEIGKAPVKLIITNPRDRVQWVSSYTVEALRHIHVYDASVERLRKALEGSAGADAASTAARGMMLFDLGLVEKAEQQFNAALVKQAGNGDALLGLGYVALHARDPKKADSYFERAASGSDELRGLGRVAAKLQTEQFKAALEALQALIAKPDLKQPAAYLMLSDLMMYGGEPGKAIEYLQQGAQRFPSNPQISSQMARVYLFSDQPEQSRNQVQTALKQSPQIVEAYLNLGALAKQQGDAKGAESAYLAAIALKPEDDRGWYGLGAVNGEKEEVKQGRANLNQALARNPKGAGYRGELATLETFANNLVLAESEYAQALQDNPSDYIALTGSGLLALKRGKTQEALDAFLKASVIEPRYARVHMYTAVAYYQLGRTRRALEELARAKELDAKDPFPYMLASMIYGDHFESGEAIAEGREALRRMPYLKSLNQIANDQKGAANLGHALAFFGMEEWAFNHAQESYNLLWGGSHLFLADRYPNLFNKNSELFQGYLVDPTAFGGSNRFQTLLPKPGNYFGTGLRYEHQDEMSAAQLSATANGYANSVFPTAYFLDARQAKIYPGSSDLRADSTNLTAALGANPVHELGLFGFATRIDTTAKLNTYPVAYKSDRVDLGGHYKLSPTSQIWLKLGTGTEKTTFDANTPDGNIGYVSNTDKREYQLRHIFSAGENAEVSWGAESATLDMPQTLAASLANFPDLLVTLAQTAGNRSRDAYVSGRFSLGSGLLIQGDLFHQSYTRTMDTMQGVGGIAGTFSRKRNELSDSRFNARAGLVKHWGENRLLRAAYQEWTRPASVSTLSSVTTAGIPLDDELVSPGGRIVRSKAQLEWEWSPTTFTTLYLDHRKVKNGPVSALLSSYLDGLDKLTGNNLTNAASLGGLEGTPLFDAGKAFSAGFALNRILSPRWSVYARYVYTDSEITDAPALAGFPIPYLPRHLVMLGSTWSGPQRVFVNALAIWRSARFAKVERDERAGSPGIYDDNSTRLNAGWDAGIRAYWESQDKNWSADGFVTNIFSKNVSTYYGINVKYRF